MPDELSDPNLIQDDQLYALHLSLGSQRTQGPKITTALELYLTYAVMIHAIFL